MIKYFLRVKFAFFVFEEIINHLASFIAICYWHIKVENDQIIILILIKLRLYEIKCFFPVACFIYLAFSIICKHIGHDFQLNVFIISYEYFEHLVSLCLLYLLLWPWWNVFIFLLFINNHINNWLKHWSHFQNTMCF